MRKTSTASPGGCDPFSNQDPVGPPQCVHKELGRHLLGADVVKGVQNFVEPEENGQLHQLVGADFPCIVKTTTIEKPTVFEGSLSVGLFQVLADMTRERDR